MNSIQNKRLTISISQIAPLVGLDAYNNFPRIVCEIWRKYDPVNFKKIESMLKLKGLQISTSSDMNDIWEADEALGTNILEQVKQINSNKEKSSSAMVSQQEAITKYINTNTKLQTMDDIKKQELAKKVCSATNKMHGVINEDSVLAEFCRLTEKTIKDTQGWINIPVSKISTDSSSTESSLPINWFIVGKYDAITTDNELVEAKMRQKCLFKKVRDYENVQVQLYMHGLQLEQGYLVESYTNKKGENNIYVNDIKYDSDYINDIVLVRISQFIKFFEMFLGDDEIKESLLSGDGDRKIYKIYEKEYLCIEDLDF